MVEGALVLSANYVAQAIAAAAFALVLVRFYQAYRQHFLLTWGLSSASFSAYLLGAAAVLAAPPQAATARAAAATVSLVGGYWQLAWLLFGTYEVSQRQPFPPFRRRLILAALAVASCALVLASAPLAAGPRLVARGGLLSLVASICFVAAGVAVWRIGRRRAPDAARPRRIGRPMVAVLFILYGLQQLQSAVFLVFQAATPHAFSFGFYLAPLNFLFQAAIGLGAVVWLLEEERHRVVASSARIEHLAYHDTLTGLPNRNFLLQQLGAALDAARRRQSRLAVLFVDLDRFKAINDSLGYGCGDDALVAVARRLRQRLGEGDVLARVGGDEFAVLLPATASEEEIARIAGSLLETVRAPYAIGGREICLTASCGISRYPEDGDQAEELLNKADIAMVRAKQQGRDYHQVYSPTMSTHHLEHLALENDLRKAIGEQQFVLFFQPVLDSRSETIDGLEALLRWQHPQRGLLAPDEFLWLAELAGLGSALDLWVLRTACREATRWNQEGRSPLRVAVNLSARPFQHPNLLDRVGEVLGETGLPPSCLELEITETLAMHNPMASLAVLRGLKDLGVRISIDDFGTGYSSLSYLSNFPIDTLKVDASFVRRLGTTRHSDEIVAAVIALAHSLHIEVVAEGVELGRQLDILRRQGCDRVQGFLLSPPLTGDETRRLLAGGRRLLLSPVA
jgi:diguanylate cyclase (GGDEF)-like protein